MAEKMGEIDGATLAFLSAMDQMDMVDLSHTLEEDMPVWPTHPRFFHNLVDSYTKGDVSCHYQLTMGEHTGTHLDAPLHFARDGSAHYGVDSIDLRAMCGRAATMSGVGLGKNELFTRRHVEAWEAERGSLKAGDVVLIRFGWDKLWTKHPGDAEFLSGWPGVSTDAADYFVQKGMKLVGTDTIALDPLVESNSPAHQILLNHEVLIAENLNNLELLPSFSYFMALPLKIRDGSGSPIRPVAFVPRVAGEK